MIDTIRFKIDWLSECFEKIKDKGDHFLQENKTEGTKKYDFNKFTFNVPSYSYKINYCADERGLVIEFSIPKYAYGHNLKEIDVESSKIALETFRKELIRDIGFPLPELAEWTITRIDLCKNIHFNNTEEAERVLKGYQRINYKNLHQVNYRNESTTWKATDYYMKFYMKGYEYIKHDHQRLNNDELLETSKKILRFEITLRTRILKRRFGGKISINQLTNEKVQNVLDFYMNEIQVLKPQTNTIEEITDKLISKYGKTRAIQLLLFYQGYIQVPTWQKTAIKNNFSRTQIYRNIKLIKEAGIGVMSEREQAKKEYEEEIEKVQSILFADTPNVVC